MSTKVFASVWPKLCAGLLYASVLVLPVLTYAEDHKQQLKNIQQNIAEKEKNVKQQLQQRNQLQAQLRQQDQTIALIGKALHTAQATLSNLDKEIATLNVSIRKLQTRYVTQQELLAKQLDIAFRQGQNSAMSLILSSEESRRSERILAYFNYLNQARQRTMDELDHTQIQLTEQKRTLLQKQTQHKNLLDQQAREQSKLEAVRNTRQGTLKSLDASLQHNQKKLTELKQNQRHLRDKIAKAEQEARARAEQEAREAANVRQKEQQAKQSGSTYRPTADERSLMARTGGLGRPAGQNIWPVRGRTLHQFGEQQQGQLHWKGMVIAAPEGNEVKAIAAGRVLLADWLQGYGLVVVVEHGQGDMSLYGYNQSALVTVGNQVQAGQSIALVGNSGGQEQSALYFEIRRRGQAVNPQPWLGH